MTTIKVMALEDGTLTPVNQDGRKAIMNLQSTRVYVCNIDTSKKRSVDQNRLWAAIYKRISEQLGAGTAEDIKDWRAECKLNHGVPIMRRDSDKFEEDWRKYLSGKNYEQQLDFMKRFFGDPDGFPVTRQFNTKQGKEYTDALADTYVPQGVYLDDLLSDKNGR